VDVHLTVRAGGGDRGAANPDISPGAGIRAD
jgi:hypothetical protein